MKAQQNNSLVLLLTRNGSFLAGPARRCIGAWIIVALGVVVPLQAQEFSGMVVFGDSWTDTGNIYALWGIPVSPPYFEGHLSNGPMWVERLAERLELPPPAASMNGGTNYAWAAASTGSVPNPFGVVDMDAQVLEFLETGSPAADELFILWGGGNDFYFGQEYPELAVAFLADQISDLAAAGARRFLVGNLPPDQYIALDYVESFNMSLSEELLNLQLTHTDISIGEFDYFGVFSEHQNDPEAFGFTVVDSYNPACRDCGFGMEPDPGHDIVPNPDEYYFWDYAPHWTAPAHQLIGDAAFNSVPAERVPFDIKPVSDSNPVNLKSKGVLPCAVLSTDDFDALDVDVASILFGDPQLIREGATPVSPIRSAEEDVNGDGVPDLSLKFSMREVVGNGVLGPLSTAGSLTAATFGGTEIVGLDTVRIVGH